MSKASAALNGTDPSPVSTVTPNVSCHLLTVDIKKDQQYSEVFISNVCHCLCSTKGSENLTLTEEVFPPEEMNSCRFLTQRYETNMRCADCANFVTEEKLRGRRNHLSGG